MKSDRTNWPLPVSIFVLTLAYFVSGRIGMLLAIPPGYATAVWPASGVALAALLLYGYRLWPGVLLGSFLANIFVSFDGSSSLSIAKSILIATGIGTGAALQALIGAWLVNRFVDMKSGLTASRDVLLFLGLGGPISCLVNATWGVSALLLSSEISISEYAFSWLTWWIGDTIGVIVFLPFLFILLGGPPELWHWRRAPLGLPLALSITIVITFFFLASNTEQKRIELKFREHANVIGENFTERWNDYIGMLYSIKGLMTTIDTITEKQFRQFLGHNQEYLPGIQALEWLPVVPDHARPAFEASIRQNGYPHFQITERDPGGQLIKAASRPYHVPVLYIFPFPGNEKALGYDVYSNPIRREAMEKARDTALPIATARIILVQETGHQAGILVFLPVYQDAGTPLSVEKRRKNLCGFAVGVFRIGDVLRHTLKGLQINYTEIDLVDETISYRDNELVTYRVSGDGTGKLISVDQANPMENDFTWSTIFNIGGRTWRLSVNPTPQYITNNRSWAAWGALTVGLMFTGLLGTFLLILTGKTLLDKQRASGLLALNTALNDEIKERKQAEEKLEKSQANLAEAQRIASMGSWEWDVQQNNMYCSDEIYVLLGVPLTQSYITIEDFFTFVHPDDREKADFVLKESMAGKMPYDLSYRITRPDGSKRIHHARAEIFFDENDQPIKMVGTLHDITNRKNLEDQLKQAQRLESIGNLAGGVAHDFNNILSIILGNTEIIMEDLDKANPVFADLMEIKMAAERSADLTRQLLAFACKQTIAPKVIDINQTIEGMLKMLKRLIGENIDFAWNPKHGLWTVKVDPSQVDQMLANLCVNARDSIDDIGKIIIETDNTVFNEEYCRHHLYLKPGEYVMIAVSDNGCGMDEKTRENIFEPFFTTKGIGQGTGLGLATVYGIVKQNNGFINVYSELNKGTTFKIYLPRNVETMRQQIQRPEDTVARGNETILLVEDEKAILRSTTTMLRLLGYSVLTASSPTEAITIAELYSNKIDMLMTDVIMPEMNGRELAKNLSRLYPDIGCLFMSGYTANVIAHHGVLDEGVYFINKPFTKQALAKMVREVLGGKNPSHE